MTAIVIESPKIQSNSSQLVGKAMASRELRASNHCAAPLYPQREPVRVPTFGSLSGRSTLPGTDYSFKRPPTLRAFHLPSSPTPL